MNGVTSRPLSWAGPYFGEGSAAASLAVLRDCGAFLMGRGTYDLFSQQWPGATGDYADHLNAMPKYVFSSTLTDPLWTNTSVISGDVVAAVAELKRASGKDLMVYGHGRLGQTLTDAGLVDELTLTVVPVFVDSGEPMYVAGGATQGWELISAAPGERPGSRVPEVPTVTESSAVGALLHRAGALWLEPVLHAVADCLGPRPHADLLIGGADDGLHRVDAEVRRGRDVVVAEALRDQGQDLGLARAEDRPPGPASHPWPGPGPRSSACPALTTTSPWWMAWIAVTISAVLEPLGEVARSAGGSRRW